MRLAALWIAAVLSAPAAASEPPSGWVRQANSLLLYDSSSTVVSEFGLGSWEEQAKTRIETLETRGGAAPGGRFAWTLELRSSWNTGRTKRLKYEGLFKYMGTSGAVLWTATDVDLPRNGDPVLLGAGGEIVLVALRSTKGWSVAAKSYVGNTLYSTGSFSELESIELTANGLYALARWREAEKSATHSFLDLTVKSRKDIPSGEFLLGQGRVTAEGKVYSGNKVIFDFSSPPAP